MTTVIPDDGGFVPEWNFPIHGIRAWEASFFHPAFS